jgi:hypothetical protein
MHRLDEVSYADLTPLGACLKKHLGKNRFIHFSKQKDRLSFNPKAFHGDPPGVYFYPVDWLWNHEDFHDHQQFGTNWPYYWIAEIDFNCAGLDLDTLTHEEVRAVGRAQRLVPALSEFRALASAQEHWRPLWEFLKNRNAMTKLPDRESEGIRWLKSLKGIAWIKDSHWVIHSNEPEQLCAIDPRVIRLIESGTQPRIEQHDWEHLPYWKHALTTLFTTLQDKAWRAHHLEEQDPSWEVTGDNWSFLVEWAPAFALTGLRISWRTGRATDTDRISARFMRDSTMEEIVEKIEGKLQAVKDLTAKTCISNRRSAPKRRRRCSTPSSSILRSLNRKSPTSTRSSGCKVSARAECLR